MHSSRHIFLQFMINIISSAKKNHISQTTHKYEYIYEYMKEIANCLKLLKDLHTLKQRNKARIPQR